MTHYISDFNKKEMKRKVGVEIVPIELLVEIYVAGNWRNAS